MTDPCQNTIFFEMEFFKDVFAESSLSVSEGLGHLREFLLEREEGRSPLFWWIRYLRDIENVFRGRRIKRQNSLISYTNSYATDFAIISTRIFWKLHRMFLFVIMHKYLGL